MEFGAGKNSKVVIDEDFRVPSGVPEMEEDPTEVSMGWVDWELCGADTSALVRPTWGHVLEGCLVSLIYFYVYFETLFAVFD